LYIVQALHNMMYQGSYHGKRSSSYQSSYQGRCGWFYQGKI